LLHEGGSEYLDDDDDRYDDGETDYEVAAEQTNRNPHSGIDDYLEKKSKEELLDIINGVISRNQEIREDLNYKAQITRGKPSALVKMVEREILKASSQSGEIIGNTLVILPIILVS
jgi:hypothetical protein